MWGDIEQLHFATPGEAYCTLHHAPVDRDGTSGKKQFCDPTTYAYIV